MEFASSRNKIQHFQNLPINYFQVSSFFSQIQTPQLLIFDILTKLFRNTVK